MIDINEFLQPISQNSECGEYLGYDYVYNQIQECIREDDPQLSQGVWQTEIKKANWNQATKIICNLLKNKTKDLQLLTWLTESLVAQNGLPGLVEGINITVAVAEKFWDKIYPVSNDENHRMMPFFYLEEKISKQLVQLPITDILDNEYGAFSVASWLTAKYNFKIKNRKGLTLDNVRKGLQTTSTEFLQKQKELAKQGVDCITRLIDFLNKKTKAESPSFKNSLEYLNTIEYLSSQTLNKIQTTFPPKIKNTIQKEIEETPEQKEKKEEDTPLPEKKIEEKELSIENAYATLEKISNFLKKEQPQSPASILIKIATSIGKKSFQELLDINTESNSTAINTIYELYKILVPNKTAEDSENNSKTSK